MWLMTSIGFFSVVQKPGDKGLTVRARIAADLDRLREQYMPGLSHTVAHAGTDYPYRATIGHAEFALGLVDLVREIDYSNFKNEVAKTMGHEREQIYAEVWSVLRKLEHKHAGGTASAVTAQAKGKALAYGGVVFDEMGRVLLREARSHFDGYVWTFPKGRQEQDETPEEAALREVEEETGVAANIVNRLAGTYEGGTTINTFFVMSAERESGQWNEETQAIRWATPEEAQQLIRMTTNRTGRERDLDVLRDAVRLYRALQD